MNKLLDEILARPQAQKIAILAVAVILLSALYYTFLYGPQSEAISKLAESVETTRNEKTSKQRQGANLARLQQELVEIEVKLKEVVAQLPDRKEIPDLLSNLSTKAREAGLEILLFRPRAERFQEFYAEIPVDIVVRGGFQNAVTFFDDVSKLSRIVNIDNIDFRNPKTTGDQVVLDVSNLATTYRFLDEAERKKVAEEKAKADKAKK
ncbi:MAG: type 4a pilus biogenesis protein PilO [Deltaproteobacteria bacterium]|nr:type 4a pilus biogenesis protein PilO [Deltaproteobacteria bacterium]MDZ4347837.1 type 4a pilus biogenesis protein PilO [Candidatus Binatia bacterium]